MRAPAADRAAELGSLDVLLVGSDGPERAAVGGLLEDDGHRVAVAENSGMANAQLARAIPAVVVVDLATTPGAAKCIRALANHGRRIPVIAIARRGQPASARDALLSGAVDILIRPVHRAELAAALANAREFASLAASALPPSDPPVNGLFAASPAMRELVDVVGRLAPMRCGILIVGERGSGRGAVAWAIHSFGQRDEDAAAPEFVTVECARTSGSESELTSAFHLNGFGGGAQHRSTGEPVGRSRGRDREAEIVLAATRRTVFLRNIEELSDAAQRRLESLLSDAEVARRSARGPRQVRTIATADPSITDVLDRREFRQELFDRLAVVRLDVPPLRQRPQDIPVLASHFLKEACREHGSPPKTFSRSAMALLSALPWRGNTTELKSLAERLAVLVSRGVVLQEDVLAHVRLDGASALGRTAGTLREARERFERDFVTAVLQHHHGRMGDAARELGIERTNLYRKIKQLHISWQGRG